MFWQLRFLRNALFASVPGFTRLRRWKRSVVPYDTTIDEDTLQQGIEMTQMLRGNGRPVAGAVVLEWGSGWKPVIPLLMRLAGARSVVMVDAERLMDARLLRETAKGLLARAAELSARLGVDEATIRATLDLAEPHAAFDAMADRLGLVYLAPFDGRRLPFSPGEIDIVCSRAVLEHIPPDRLRGLFDEAARVLLPGAGCMCHIIDNSDHWAHGDRRLSMVNFLRYGDATWQWLAVNPLDYMNRLRHSEYVDMFRAAGFDVLYDGSEPDPAALGDVGRLRIHPRFLRFAREDLATLTSRLVARRAVS